MGNQHVVRDIAPPRLAVIGHGFLPGQAVVIRVIDADEMTSYLQYTADLAGDLFATLPASLPHGTLHLSATDSRLDATDETGIRWTNTATISW